MERYIKYKRIVKEIKGNGFQQFFDDLIKEGWEIIHYNEKPTTYTEVSYAMNKRLNSTTITVVVGRKQKIEL